MNLDVAEGVVRDSIKDGAFPGAAFAVYHKGEFETRYFGRETYCPESKDIDANSLWDLASLTKVVATTSVAMMLFDRGQLVLDKPLMSVIPEFLGAGKEAVTFRNLLLHDAGLMPDLLKIESYFSRHEILEAVYAAPLEYPTGSKMVYSDLSMILLAEAMHRISGESLDVYASKNLFDPLGMKDTDFSPRGLHRKTGETNPEVTERCVPTELLDPWRVELRNRRFTAPEQSRLFGKSPAYIQAEVHDPTAAVLEGVAGHAGLFSTLSDLIRFMIGLTEGKFAKLSTVADWTRCQSALSSRALGWDTKSAPSSAGTLFGDKTFGHTGYTGTSIWCDPDQNLFAILLTNRVHPSSDNNKIRLVRPAFHDAVFASLVG
jgi:CubicO group peptidase (beta-lactamase class C family)